jgi:hypothetical protein
MPIRVGQDEYLQLLQPEARWPFEFRLRKPKQYVKVDRTLQSYPKTCLQLQGPKIEALNTITEVGEFLIG